MKEKRTLRVNIKTDNADIFVGMPCFFFATITTKAYNNTLVVA